MESLDGPEGSSGARPSEESRDEVQEEAGEDEDDDEEEDEAEGDREDVPPPMTASPSPARAGGRHRR